VAGWRRMARSARLDWLSPMGRQPRRSAVREPLSRHGLRYRRRSAWPGQADACRPLRVLPGGSGDVGGDDVGCVPVQGGAGSTWRIVVRGSGWEAASWTSRSGTPASSAAVMNACRSVCGPTGLAIPARRATRRTIRPAPCRSRRRPSAARKTGPSMRSPMARSIARAVRGASGTVTTCRPCG